LRHRASPAAAAPISARAATRTTAATAADGTPEQIHLTWGDDPASSVTVSWASPGPARRPRVVFRHAGGGSHVVPAAQRVYTDGINGETVSTYHAELTGLRPSSAYGYTVTADNDTSARPFAATFSTAPRGRQPFRFTSFGDLATPNTQWVLSYGQSADAVAAVESFRPLFHLLNGDLCYANLNPATQPEVWRDFGNNNQASAAHRAWMPCLGNHEVEFDNGTQVFTKPNRPIAGAAAGTFTRAAADAVEDAPWSAKRDTSTGYGIAVFDVDPGVPGGHTSIKVTQYHALGADPVNPTTGAAGAPTPDYTEFETFTLIRPRSDRRAGHTAERASALA
jgi:hypothetical protein